MDKNWGQGGQIFYCDGKAWGITHNLKTICMGNEADILKALKENMSLGNPTIDNILTTEKNLW